MALAALAPLLLAVPRTGPYHVSEMEYFPVPGLTGGAPQGFPTGNRSAAIVYPAGAGPARRFPVVVYGHGAHSYVSDPAARAFFAATLGAVASHGFIVVAPDSCPQVCNFIHDMLATLDAARADPPPHPALGRADRSASGVMGYSNGAAASYGISINATELAARNVRAVVVQHEGCEDPSPDCPFCGVPPRRCGTPQVPTMFTTGSNDTVGYPAWEHVYQAYRTATVSPSIFISLSGAPHVPVDTDDLEPIAQFLTCYVRAEQAGCDAVFGSSGAAVCRQPFKLANPDGSFGCEVNQSKPPVPAAAAPPPGNVEVTIPGLGVLAGKAAGGVRSFLGVPYAEPVSGDGRWRAPVAKKPWAGTRAAAAFGATCYGSGGARVSEDCLFLNVYASAAAAGPPKPVMVWLHGGGWSSGSGDRYAGDAIVAASNSAVVVVTLNYRLNIFGFLASDQLRNRTDGGSTGNYGLQDQRLALRWVKDNIAAFGGDPSRVMLFGESAGSSSVVNHLVMPQSGGLFHRAGLESGAPSYGKSMAEKEAIFAGVLASTKCATVSCLVAAPAATLEGLVGGVGDYLPTVDGVEMAAQPWRLLRSGQAQRMPVLLGTNRDEEALFPPFPTGGAGWDEARFDGVVADITRSHRPELVPAVKALYNESRYDLPADLAGRPAWWWKGMRAKTDQHFFCPVRLTARWLTAGGADVYRYRFQHPPARSFIAGTACHGAEVPFVFHDTLRGPGEDALSQLMVGYWARFAAAGDPNGAGAPEWPAYSNATDPALLLDVAPAGGVTTAAKPSAEQCDFWDARWEDDLCSGGAC